MTNKDNITVKKWSEYLIKAFNKKPMGLIGPLSNCSVAFAIMFIHVHYNYRAINDILGLFNPINFLNSKNYFKKL